MTKNNILGFSELEFVYESFYKSGEIWGGGGIIEK